MILPFFLLLLLVNIHNTRNNNSTTHLTPIVGITHLTSIMGNTHSTPIVGITHSTSITGRYQRSNLMQTNFGGGPRPEIFSSYEGLEIDKPTNVADESELNEFANYVSSASKESMSRLIPPPLLRLMMQLGEVEMVNREVAWYSQENKEGKLREDFIKVGTNPNFVPIEDNTPGTYYEKDDKGVPKPLYKISQKMKRVYFPTVYYASQRGFIISCTRCYMQYGMAMEYYKNGMGDILGRRTLTKNNGEVAYRYFVRFYTVMSSFDNHSQRRNFNCSSDCMEGGLVQFELGAVILATFVGPRKKGYQVQHDGATWNNSLDFIRWITISDNHRKENIKSK
jgi:hypothetical protein